MLAKLQSSGPGGGCGRHQALFGVSIGDLLFCECPYEVPPSHHGSWKNIPLRCLHNHHRSPRGSGPSCWGFSPCLQHGL